LYGHSFGGILAYEYCKRIAEGRAMNPDAECLSAVLSSAPTDIHESNNEQMRLLNQIGPLAAGDDIEDAYRVRHVCRIKKIPNVLSSAYDNASDVWGGTDAIRTYKARPPADGVRMPPALVMRGEHDFCTQNDLDAWKLLLNRDDVREHVFHGCSHHTLLENGAEYCEVLQNFFADHD